MKTQTWLPKKRPIARTLADVPSSREKPVLCWFSDGSAVSPMWITGNCVWRADREGMIVRCNGKYTDFKLYDQPPRPTKLENVPDRWVIHATFTSGHEYLLFRNTRLGLWQGFKSGCSFTNGYLLGQDNGETPVDWQLTDCIAELVEVEVEVMG